MKVVLLTLLLIISVLSQTVQGQQTPKDFLAQSGYHFRCGRDNNCFEDSPCCKSNTGRWCCGLGQGAVCCGSYCCEEGSICGHGKCTYPHRQAHLNSVQPEQ